MHSRIREKLPGQQCVLINGNGVYRPLVVIATLEIARLVCSPGVYTHARTIEGPCGPRLYRALRARAIARFAFRHVYDPLELRNTRQSENISLKRPFPPPVVGLSSIDGTQPQRKG